MRRMLRSPEFWSWAACVCLLAGLALWGALDHRVFGGYFGFPYGLIWSNLLASALGAGLVLWRQRFHHLRQLAQARAHHNEQMRLQKEHNAQLRAQASRHHLELGQQIAGKQ